MAGDGRDVAGVHPARMFAALGEPFTAALMITA